jgi:hypothetical protein
MSEGKETLFLPFTTTGIVADLLKGGRTEHSGFKLQIVVLDTSISSMKMTSNEAQKLRIWCFNNNNNNNR